MVQLPLPFPPDADRGQPEPDLDYLTVAQAAQRLHCHERTIGRAIDRGTYAYHKSHDLPRKMAMEIGGQYKPEYVERRHLDRLLGDAGLGDAAARRRLRGHALAAPSAAREVRSQLAAEGWDARIFDVIIEIVDRLPTGRRRARSVESAESTAELPEATDPA